MTMHKKIEDSTDLELLAKLTSTVDHTSTAPSDHQWTSMLLDVLCSRAKLREIELLESIAESLQLMSDIQAMHLWPDHEMHTTNPQPRVTAILEARRLRHL